MKILVLVGEAYNDYLRTGREVGQGLSLEQGA